MFHVKKILAGLLLTLYLSTFPVAMELLRLPNLLIHFLDHQEDGRPQAVTHFFWQHYVMEDGSDSDADQDEELPFKSLDHFANNFWPVMETPIQMEYDLSRELMDGLPQARYLNPAGQSFDKAIWQPPRKI